MEEVAVGRLEAVEGTNSRCEVREHEMWLRAQVGESGVVLGALKAGRSRSR